MAQSTAFWPAAPLPLLLEHDTSPELELAGGGVADQDLRTPGDDFRTEIRRVDVNWAKLSTQ